MDRYIDGADLARLFREKLQPTKFNRQLTMKTEFEDED
jgi:hypothetical protein